MPPPPPPLEAWPAIDDALLRLAIESGVAVEALSGARACVEFVSGRKAAAGVRAAAMLARFFSSKIREAEVPRTWQKHPCRCGFLWLS